MQPRILQPARLSRSGLLAAALGFLVAGLVGYGLSHYFPHRPAQTFRAQVYDSQSDPNYNIGMPLRPMDIEILKTLAAGRYTRAQVTDLFPRRPYQVRFVGNADWIDVVVIDLDRDGTWDERWQLKEHEIKRRIVDKTGSTGGIPFELRKGRWVPY